MPRHHGGLIPSRSGVQESLVGHDQVDRDRHLVCGRLSGEPLDQRVGHHLAAVSLVARDARRVGGPHERGQRRDTLGDREQGGEPGHRVRSRPQADPPLVRRPAGAVEVGLRVEPVGDPAGFALDLPIPPLVQVRGQLLVGVGPVLVGEEGGLPHHQHRPPLGRHTRAQGLEGRRVVGGESPRPLDEPGRPMRRAPLRQSHFGGDPTPDVLVRDATSRLLITPYRDEPRGLPRLRSCSRRLQLLQQPDPVDRLSRIIRRLAVPDHPNQPPELCRRQSGDVRHGGDMERATHAGESIEHMFERQALSRVDHTRVTSRVTICGVAVARRRFL